MGRLDRLRGNIVVVLVALATAAGCHASSGTPPPNPGVLQVSVAPAPVTLANLQVTSGAIKVEGFVVLGDVPPDGRSMIPELTIDLSTMASQTFTFSMLPSGVYSRVRFNIDHVQLDGAWRGVPLHLSYEPPDGSTVDLRAASDIEIAPGQNGAFDVTVDVDAWFANNLLDSATQVSGSITIDFQNNPTVLQQIEGNLISSFSLGNAAPVP